LLAALALGAEGVVLGTRFLATPEAAAQRLFIWRCFISSLLEEEARELDICNHDHSPTHEDWVFKRLRSFGP
jgi:hypothetical protein